MKCPHCAVAIHEDWAPITHVGARVSFETVVARNSMANMAVMTHRESLVRFRVVGAKQR